MPANLSAANQRENLRLSNSATSATFAWVSSGRLLSAVLTGLVHVLDRGLVHHKIGSAHAIYLQRFDELLAAAKEEKEQERERGGDQ